MEPLFWTALALVLYVYLGYPVLLAVWSRLAPRPVQRSPATPAISIVIAARNEGRSLRARLDNLLTVDYPADRMQIIVVSDGSTDNTTEILCQYQPRVDYRAPPVRG